MLYIYISFSHEIQILFLFLLQIITPRAQKSNKNEFRGPERIQATDPSHSLHCSSEEGCRFAPSPVENNSASDSQAAEKSGSGQGPELRRLGTDCEVEKASEHINY
jgi:hypothetical protein